MPKPSLHILLAVLAWRKLIHSARDISDGGIAVALAQAAFTKGIGATVEQEQSLLVHPLFGLFAEPASTMIVSTDPRNLPRSTTMAGQYNFFSARIGTTGGSRLEISVDGEPFISAPLAELRSALGLRAGSHSPWRGHGMSRVLFQGVPGVADISELLPRQRPVRRSSVQPSTAGAADKLHEECGVVAISRPSRRRAGGLPGLYALQHRGQESAGIATADGQHLANIKGMGLVSEIFTDDVLAQAARSSWRSATRATPPPATRRC